MLPDKSQRARDFETVIREAPKNSSEHRLYFGKGFTPAILSLEHRISYLRNRAPHLSFKYKEAAITYLKEELEKRRKQGK